MSHQPRSSISPSPTPSLGLTFTLTLIAATVAIAGYSLRSLAHGVNVESEPIQSLQMRASFDSGDPMAEAQVTIYSPANPETPWQELSADENGYFIFTPDPAIAGDWEVQVRKAGHGDLVRVTVDEANGSPLAYASGSSQQGGQSPAQKWTTIAAAIWGFVGTALFFAQRQPSQTKGSEIEASLQELPSSGSDEHLAKH